MRKERFPTLDECETFHFGGECDVRILGRGFVMHNVSVRISCLKTYDLTVCSDKLHFENIFY